MKDGKIAVIPNVFLFEDEFFEMNEERRLKYYKWLSAASLLLPSISFIVLFNLPRLPEIIEMPMLVYVGVCLVAPPILGVYLLVTFFVKKDPRFVLVLAILNIVSPVWSLYFLLYLTFRKGGFTLPM